MEQKKTHTPFENKQKHREILVFAPQGNVHDKKYKDKASNVFLGGPFLAKDFWDFNFYPLKARCLFSRAGGLVVWFNDAHMPRVFNTRFSCMDSVRSNNSMARIVTNKYKQTQKSNL